MMQISKEEDLPIITVGCPIQDRESYVKRYLLGINELNYPSDHLKLLFLVNNCSDNTERILYKYKHRSMDKYYDFQIETYVFDYKDDREDRDPNKFVEIWNEWLKYIEGDYVLTIDSDVYIEYYDLYEDVKLGHDIIGGQVWNGGLPPTLFYSVYYDGGKIIEKKTDKTFRHYIHHTIPFDIREKVFGIGGCIRLIKSKVFDDVKFQYHPQGEDLGLCDSIKDNTDYDIWINPHIHAYHDMNIKKYIDAVTVKKKVINQHKFYPNNKEGE